MATVTIPAITGGVVERYEGDRLTCTAAAAVRGGRLVELTGAATGHTVQEAQANSLAVLGVALYDADPATDIKKTTVATEGVFDLIASGNLNAGDHVKAGAAGVAVAIAGDVDPRLAIGIALDDVTSGASGPVKLRL